MNLDFTDKRVAEIEVFTVDYIDDLAPGETITSAVWTNSVKLGTDPTPNAMILGAATINGTKVSQRVGGGVAGVYYYPICTAQTSLTQTLVLPDPGRGSLKVVA